MLQVAASQRREQLLSHNLFCEALLVTALGKLSSFTRHVYLYKIKTTGVIQELRSTCVLTG